MNPDNVGTEIQLQDLQKAAHATAQHLLFLNANSEGAIDTALATIVPGGQPMHLTATGERTAPVACPHPSRIITAATTMTHEWVLKGLCKN